MKAWRFAAFAGALASCTVPDYSFAPAPLDAGAHEPKDGSAPFDSGMEAAASPCRDTEKVVGGHCYRFTSDVVLCNNVCDEGHLAAFETEDEYAAVTDAMGSPPKGTRYYIGMAPKDGQPSDAATSFVWITDAAVTYSHWGPSQPSGDKLATCVLQDVDLDAGATWFDHRSDDAKIGLCERTP